MRPGSSRSRNTATYGPFRLGCSGSTLGKPPKGSIVPISNSGARTNSGRRAPFPSRGASRVVAWYAEGGQQLNALLRADLAAIGDADKAAIGNACGTLVSHIAAARKYRRMPDTQAQAHWGAVLTHLKKAADDCAAGTARGDTDLLASSQTAIRAAAAEMRAVTERVDALSRTGA